MIVPAKFGEFWTCFDPPIVKSWIEPRAKTKFLRRIGFFLSPVEPALPMIQPVFNWGFRPRFLVAPGALVSTCIGSTGVTTGFAVLPVQPAYRISLTSV